MKDGAAARPKEATHDEEELLAGLRSRDGPAFEQLVRGSLPRMLSVARRILGNEEDAQEAVQEAFLSVVKSIDGFDGESKLSTWLHRIVVNAAIGRLRQRARSHERSIDDLLPRFQEDEHQHQVEPNGEWRETAGRAIEQAETAALVRAAIDQLPRTYRTVILLRDIEELDTAETARILGVTAPVVKVRLHRARQALRTLLDAHLRVGAL